MESSFDFALVTLVESKPVLWDASDLNYKNRDKSAQAWEAIATHIGGKIYQIIFFKFIYPVVDIHVYLFKVMLLFARAQSSRAPLTTLVCKHLYATNATKAINARRKLG